MLDTKVAREGMVDCDKPLNVFVDPRFVGLLSPL